MSTKRYEVRDHDDERQKLVDTVTGWVIFIEGEPEDMTLRRDLRPLVDLLNAWAHASAFDEWSGVESAGYKDDEV